jgi:hypothetical protein
MLNLPDLRHGVSLFALTLLAILVDGYHPYSEDAGIYVASIKQLAHPGMYATSGVFLAPYVRLSLFSHIGALLIGALHLPFEALLFAIHLATTWLLLYACHGLAKRCFQDQASRRGAVLLVALCLAVPVAGTSLSMMDPYLTGRSFSTPFALLAAGATLDRRMLRVCLFLGLALLFHPLMGAYAVGFSLVIWAVMRRSGMWQSLTSLGTIAMASFALAVTTGYSRHSVMESPAYRAAVATRNYFFLSQWRWYELLGLLAPVCLLAIYGAGGRQREDREGRVLALTGAAMGLIAVTVSLVFCHVGSASYQVAALQPLRPFLFVYFVLFLILGALLGQRLLQQAAWRWVVGALILGMGLGVLQHLVYPASDHIEVPMVSSRNPWHRAFDWIRSNTPPNAIVALDADYINASGEDSLGFRAVAERDSLADRSKDGGAAAVFPQLAGQWLREESATTGLNRVDDAERRRRLAPFHVSWVVLDGTAATSMPCPFTTKTVKVCQFQ